MSVVKDFTARALDGASFAWVNALQLRRRAGRITGEAFRAYVDQWAEKSLQDYYAVPDHAPPPDLPEKGSWTRPSPHPIGWLANDHVHLHYWPGPRGWNSPVMFLLHGVMSVSEVGYRLWAQTLNRLGWGAMFFHLPFHYGRRPPWVWTGEPALSANFILTAEAIRQAVIELRWVCAGLKARGVPHIGLWGTSYGGWIGGLLLALEPRLSTAWLLEPIADVDHAIWESPAARVLRYQARAEGITREDCQRHYRLVCPSHQQPLIRTDRILLFAGTFDRIAPPQQLRCLHERWPGSIYREFRQGHVGYQLMPESLKLAQAAFPDLFPPQT
ncbi:MAG: prolyl oligopeptidase family serine peptidase [Candidatus Methylacidiphilales bacterium]